MKITKTWIRKWEPCDEAVKWIEEQDTTDAFELIRKLRHSNVSNKYDWLFWAIPRLIKTEGDKIRFAAYCIEFIALPIIEDGYYQKVTKDTKDAIQYAAWSIDRMIEAIYWVTTKKNKVGVNRAAGITRAVTRAVIKVAEAVVRAGKYVDERRDVIIEYGIKLLKEQSNEGDKK